MLRIAKIVILIFAAAGLAWMSFAHAMSGVGKKNPQLVLRFQPSDPAALSLLADVELVQPDKKGYLERAEALARRSAAAQVINPRALRQLGLIEDARGDKNEAERLIRLSDKMSRRDLGAQFWLVRREAEKDNLTAAVRHIDNGLKTNPNSYEMLFPILTKAIENKEVQQEVAEILRTNPSWIASFLDFATAQSEDLSSVVAIMQPLPRSMRGYDSARQDRQLLDQLINKKQYVLARQYYLSKPAAVPSLLSTINFSDAAVSAGDHPFGWKLLDNSAAAADFEKADEGRQLFIRVDSARSAELLSKITYLKPGSYRIAVKYGEVSNAGSASLQYRLYCLSPETGEAVATFAQSQIRPDETRVSGIDVPSSCITQRFVIAIDGKNAVKDSQIVIRDIHLAEGTSAKIN